MEWWLGAGVIYLVLLVTVCVVTFRKGHTALGILGFFLPFLWLVGAAIHPKEGSSFAKARGY